MKYKANVSFITQRINKKVTIFEGENSILYTLNETAAYIFQGIKLGWSEEKIAKGIAEKFEVNKDTAKEDLGCFVNILLKKKFIIQK